MDDGILKALHRCRMLRTDEEVENYERNLEILAETFSEDDVAELLSTFEDDAEDFEVMFGAVHLLESVSSEKAYEKFIEGVVENRHENPEWMKTLTRRCLNDEFSAREIGRAAPRLRKETADGFRKFRRKSERKMRTIRRRSADRSGGSG